MVLQWVRFVFGLIRFCLSFQRCICISFILILIIDWVSIIAFISSNRNLLINTLNYRFRVLGFFGLILSPFILFFLITYYIFRYAEEYRSYSNKLNTREWNFYTKWKLRELNELNIVFQERINESYNYATNYVKQFHLQIYQK